MTEENIRSSTIDQRVKSIISQLPAFTRRSTPITDDNDVGQLREALRDINGDVYHHLLFIGALQLALDEATLAYKSLQSDQKGLLAKINHLTSQNKRVRLPLDVVEMICSLSCKSHNQYNNRIWEDVIYKVPHSCRFDELASEKVQTIIKNGGRIHLENDNSVHWTSSRINAQIDRILSMSKSLPSFGPWRLFKFQVIGSPKACKLYETIVQCSGSSLSTVERFEIANHPGDDLDGVEISDVANGFRSLKLPSCTSLRTPLSLLSCFPDVTSRIDHLEGWFSICEPWTFSSCFQGVDLPNLGWLEFEVFNGYSDYTTPITEDYTVVLPKMNRLSIEMNEDCRMTVETLLSLVDRFPCSHLSRLDISSSIASGDEDVPLSDAIGNLLLALGSRFKYLYWLSLHLPRSPHYIKHAAVGFKLRRPGKKVLFQYLKGISVELAEDNFNEDIPALLTLLQNRKDDKVPIQKLEIWVYASSLKVWQQALVEYLRLFVKDVVLMLRPHR